jgi:AcrR family transcriptional regulator
MVGPMAGPSPDPVPTTVPRGRHAPPLDVRLDVQRRRLFRAAATVFSRHGYADATAEAISREAGMSKATFYEHFANKEECILALFDVAATEVMRAMATATDRPRDDGGSYRAHVRAGVRGFL